MIGEAIKIVRLKLGITQAQICERAGFTQGFYSRLENGYTDTGINTLHKIAKAFGVPAIMIIALAFDKKKIEKDKRKYLDQFGKQIDAFINNKK